MSMFDDMDQMRAEGIADTVAAELFSQWIDSKLDEGVMYADWSMCSMAGDPELKKQFNEFYNVSPDDNLYFEVDNV